MSSRPFSRFADMARAQRGTDKCESPLLVYSHSSVAGSDEHELNSRKENQDAFGCTNIQLQVQKRKQQQCSLFTVCDGHGHDGRAVSNFVAKSLPKCIARACKDPKVNVSLSSVFTEAFSSCNQLLISRDCDVDCLLSGSSCAVAAIIGTKLLVANLGDSKCILGRIDPIGRCTSYALTNDHNPSQLAEANRILASGGRLASYMCGELPVGPLRVWLPDKNAPGLTMTRSFGDVLAASVGVICVPELVEIELTTEDRYLVLVSDGVSDMIGEDEIIQLVHKQWLSKKSIKQVSEKLVQEARCRWQDSKLGVIDDCTAICIQIGIPTAPCVPLQKRASAQSILTTPPLGSQDRIIDLEAGYDQNR